jgi:hypothetical protein
VLGATDAGTRAGAGAGADDEAAAAHVDAAIRVLAHGATAVCYLHRDDEEAAKKETAKVLESAEAAGVPPEDTAPLRAFVAGEKGKVGLAVALGDIAFRELERSGAADALLATPLGRAVGGFTRAAADTAAAAEDTVPSVADVKDKGEGVLHDLFD